MNQIALKRVDNSVQHQRFKRRQQQRLAELRSWRDACRAVLLRFVQHEHQRRRRQQLLWLLQPSPFVNTVRIAVRLDGPLDALFVPALVLSDKRFATPSCNIQACNPCLQHIVGDEYIGCARIMFKAGACHMFFGDTKWFSGRNFVSLIRARLIVNADGSRMLERRAIAVHDVGAPLPVSNGGEDGRLIRVGDELRLMVAVSHAPIPKNQLRQVVWRIHLETLRPYQPHLIAAPYQLASRGFEKNYIVFALRDKTLVIPTTMPPTLIDADSGAHVAHALDALGALNDTTQRVLGAPKPFPLRGSAPPLMLDEKRWLVVVHAAVLGGWHCPELGFENLEPPYWQTVPNTYNANPIAQFMQGECQYYHKRYWSMVLDVRLDANDQMTVVRATPFFLPPGRFHERAVITFAVGLTTLPGTDAVLLTYGEADVTCRADAIEMSAIERALQPIDELVQSSTRDQLFRRDLFPFRATLPDSSSCVPSGEVFVNADAIRASE